MNQPIDMGHFTRWQQAMKRSLGTSQEKLAEELGVSSNTIRRWRDKHAQGIVVVIQRENFDAIVKSMEDYKKFTGIGPDGLKLEPKEPGGDRHDSDEGQPSRAECGAAEVSRTTPSNEPEFEPQPHVTEPLEEESRNVDIFHGMRILASFQRTSRTSHSACALGKV